MARGGDAMILTRRDDTVTIEGTVDEIRALFERAQTVTAEVVTPPAVTAPSRVSDAWERESVDPQSLTVSDARRYQDTGRVGNYGERESVDVRTGRRGVVMLESMGVGFVPGATVDASGNVHFARPQDNPFFGCRW